jgi:hypothetical protein
MLSDRLRLSWLVLGSVLATAGAAAPGAEADVKIEGVQRPFFLVQDARLSTSVQERMVRALCSQYGRLRVFRTSTVSRELGALKEFGMRPKITREPMFDVMVLEYCREVVGLMLHDKGSSPQSVASVLDSVKAVCLRILNGKTKKELKAALAWQKEVEDRVRRAAMTKLGLGPDAREDPPSYPTGTHAVLEGEEKWTGEKWKTFILLRAFELSESLRVGKSKKTRHMLLAGRAGRTLPPALVRMGKYVAAKKKRSQTEESWLQHERTVKKLQERLWKVLRKIGSPGPGD